MLLFGVLGGLLLAIVISILLLPDRQSRPGSTVRTEPGLLVFRLDAAMLFLNAKLVRDRAPGAAAPQRPGRRHRRGPPVPHPGHAGPDLRAVVGA